MCSYLISGITTSSKMLFAGTGTDLFWEWVQLKWSQGWKWAAGVTLCSCITLPLLSLTFLKPPSSGFCPVVAVLASGPLPA